MRKYLHIIILFTAGLILTLSFYHKVIFDPDAYFFNDRGDAVKNYFTYAWHIRHDTSCTHFQGMNYPYGEHILYTDNHPALSELLRTFSGGEGWLSDHSVGILNVAMILSLLLTLVTLYFLMLEFGISRAVALQLGIGMALLAPQVFRMTGHFALSYSFAIPLSWLILLKALKQRKPVWPVVLLFLTGLLWMFTHAYLGIMVTGFLIVTLIILLLGRSNRAGLGRRLLLLGVTVLPVLIFQIFLRTTDSHAGRTANPSGFFLYNAEPDDLFVPHMGLIRATIDSLAGGVVNQEWEARGYIGLAASVILLMALIVFLIRAFRPKRSAGSGIFSTDPDFRASMIAAIVLLAFAMGLPFKLWPPLLDHFPVFKQFRATGRFVWPFFFTALIFSAIVLHNLHLDLKAKKKRAVSIGVIALVAVLNILEGMPYHREVSAAVTRSSNLFRRDLLPGDLAQAVSAVDPAKYQAIISLPFYYYGSEAFSRPRQPEAVRNSMVLAYHTGLPLVNADLTRTSVSESKKIVQILTPDYYEKEIKRDIIDPRPFLVVRSGSVLTFNEQKLVAKAELIRQEGEIGLYELSVGALLGQSGTPSLLTGTPSLFFFYENFETYPSDTVFREIGAFSGKKAGKNTLAEFSPGTFEAGQDYHLSIWMYNAEPDALNLYFRLIVEEFDEAARQWHETVFFPEEAETIYGDWSLVEGVFRIQDPNNSVSIVTKGKKDSRAAFHADDLLIRKRGEDIVRPVDGGQAWFYNNHRIMMERDSISLR